MLLRKGDLSSQCADDFSHIRQLPNETGLLSGGFCRLFLSCFVWARARVRFSSNKVKKIQVSRSKKLFCISFKMIFLACSTCMDIISTPTQRVSCVDEYEATLSSDIIAFSWMKRPGPRALVLITTWQLLHINESEIRWVTGKEEASRAEERTGNVIEYDSSHVC